MGASCGVALTLIALSRGPSDHVTSVDVGVPDVLYGANRIRYSMWRGGVVVGGASEDPTSHFPSPYPSSSLSFSSF